MVYVFFLPWTNRVEHTSLISSNMISWNSPLLFSGSSVVLIVPVNTVVSESRVKEGKYIITLFMVRD